MEAHHIFPQAKELQPYFEKVGINIHDPHNPCIDAKVSHQQPRRSTRVMGVSIPGYSKTLHAELPTFLVENKNMYSILSIGIHQLSEDQCKDYFAPLKLGIELILDEKLEKKQREDKINAATSALSKITSAQKKNDQ